MTDSICSLVGLKTALFGITFCNLAVFSLEAKKVEGFEFYIGIPWYISPRFSYLPILLVVAALGLHLSRWWGYLIAVGLCATVLYVGALDLQLAYGIPLWWAWMKRDPGLLFQCVVAATVLGAALIAWVYDHFSIPRGSDAERSSIKKHRTN